MILSKYKWNILYDNKYSDNEIIDILHRMKGINDYISYYNLGFKDFNDPFLFKNMDKVIKKIKLSIRNNEKILIYGDYDVDGITATAILYRTLKDKGALVDYMVPNRFSEGYGLSNDIIEDIIKKDYKLVITVDNGITNVDEVKKLMDASITVIVSDHHEPKEKLPDTEYIIHSYIFKDYPFKDLCGAGVAFKISEALDKKLAREYIDLCMLGTIADMMPIVDENKAIVNEGLRVINNTKVIGLKTLLDKISLNVKCIKDVSYNLAPKLNSLGRIGDASVAIDLLISDDLIKINEDIKTLLDADLLRKELTIQNTELANKMIVESDPINIIYSSNFYEGVLGIIAQKVMKKTGKITGVFNVDQDNNARGSFRTIGEYNILKMLEDNKDLLLKFGGHEKACGVNMLASNLKELKDRLSKTLLSLEPLESKMNIICSLNHSLITLNFAKDLLYYELEDTTFLYKDLTIVQATLLADKHTKLRVKLNDNKVVSVIVFNDPALAYNVATGDKIDIVGSINVNIFNGFENLQIIANDYEVKGIQIIDYRRRKDFKDAIKYFDNSNGLILDENFDNLSVLSLLIEEQSPNIIYLAPLDENNLALTVSNTKLLRETLYLISTSVNAKKMILQRDLKISRDELEIILVILEELSLITTNDDKIRNVPKEKGYKVSLDNSETYRYYKELSETKKLLSSDIDTIKDYVLQALE